MRNIERNLRTLAANLRGQGVFFEIEVRAASGSIYAVARRAGRVVRVRFADHEKGNVANYRDIALDFRPEFDPVAAEAAILAALNRPVLRAVLCGCTPRHPLPEGSREEITGPLSFLEGLRCDAGFQRASVWRATDDVPALGIQRGDVLVAEKPTRRRMKGGAFAPKMRRWVIFRLQ